MAGSAPELVPGIAPGSAAVFSRSSLMAAPSSGTLAATLDRPPGPVTGRERPSGRSPPSRGRLPLHTARGGEALAQGAAQEQVQRQDRKSTRLNSSHVSISYAVFCLKKNKKEARQRSE